MAEIKGDSPKIFHKWKPIEPIDSTSQAYDFGEIDSLQREWLRIKQEVEGSSPNAYKAFTDRLTRRWSIETGIIEGIYDLDRNVTNTLIEKGISTDYIERRSTDKEPAELVQILNDHQESVASVNYWIEQSRPLTKTFILGLHSQILKNQHTHRAVNLSGEWFEATLHKGKFKTLPNNPTRTDGALHEYCPPEQVESELDKLLSMYETYDTEGCHPILLAAWLHHRFAQIHPFSDGNGRVGRAILTWHLVKNNLFPIVISRDDRDAYLDSLEEADDGDLTPLIKLFVRMEKDTILQVLGESESEVPLESHPQVDLIGQLVDSIVQRAEQRRQSAAEQMRSVNDIAFALRQMARVHLDALSQDVRIALEHGGIFIEPVVLEGGPDNFNDHWYLQQVIDTAKASRHWVNRSETRYFIRLALNPTNRNEMPRLIFVISLHHIGRRLTGVMAATAFVEIEYEEGTWSDSSGESVRSDSSTFYNCALNPFTLTWNDSANDLRKNFIDWTEECLATALRHWRDNS